MTLTRHSYNLTKQEWNLREKKYRTNTDPRQKGEQSYSYQTKQTSKHKQNQTRLITNMYY